MASHSTSLNEFRKLLNSVSEVGSEVGIYIILHLRPHVARCFFSHFLARIKKENKQSDVIYLIYSKNMC